jgi:hypothetical protein
MDNNDQVPISKELTDINAFFAVFEKTQREMAPLGIPAAITAVAKDELGWYTVIRIRPNSKY